MAQTITVTGMSCEGCEQTVEETLKSLSSVTTAEADHTSDTATIDGEVDPDAIRDAIHDAGYETSL